MTSYQHSVHTIKNACFLSLSRTIVLEHGDYRCKIRADTERDDIDFRWTSFEFTAALSGNAAHIKRELEGITNLLEFLVQYDFPLSGWKPIESSGRLKEEWS
jgi:hypothetical protein